MTAVPGAPDSPRRFRSSSASRGAGGTAPAAVILSRILGLMAYRRIGIPGTQGKLAVTAVIWGFIIGNYHRDRTSTVPDGRTPTGDEFGVSQVPGAKPAAPVKNHRALRTNRGRPVGNALDFSPGPRIG